MVKNKRGPGLNLDRPPARQPLPGDGRKEVDPVVKIRSKAKAKAAATERRVPCCVLSHVHKVGFYSMGSRW
eukprot:3536576-Amphidinium_carterae.1